MKKIVSFILILLIIFTTVFSFAAEGDIIHTGLKKLYKISDDYRGLKEAVLSGVDKSKFYREDANGDYVNILAEEKAQLDYLIYALTNEGVDPTNSAAIIEFVQRPDVIDALGTISRGENTEYPDVLFKFNNIPNVGNREDYYGPSPKVEVEKVDMGTLEKGSKFVGAIKINGLEEGNYKVIALDGPLSRIYEDDMFPSSTEYNPGDDFVVIKEELLSLGFKKYVYLFKLENNKIKSYNEFIMDKDKVSLPPTLLSPGTHYIGPVKGDTDGTSQFNKLEFEEYGFKYILSNEVINTPINEVDFSSIGTGLVSSTEFEARAGDYLLLVAIDGENKVKGYAKFHLTEDNIKGITPPSFEIKAEKGSGPNTTMVKGISLEIGSKWMYAMGTELDDPVLDKTYSGAKNYSLGADIVAKSGDTLMIFETDIDGKVKRFGKAILDGNMIKASLAEKLDLDTNFRGPVKGHKAGSTKFEFLNYESLNFVYFHSNEEFSPPELDKIVNIATGKNIVMNGMSTEDMIIFEEDNPLLKSDMGFKHHILVVAVDSANKAKAYGIFELNNLNVKLPLADKLNTDPFENFTEPEKGTLPGTTLIKKLDNIGLDPSVTTFRYKIVDSKIDIEYNTRVVGVNELRQGVNIPVQLNDGEKYLLILAVDGAGRTKYYEIVKLDAGNVRSPKANTLVEGTHYTKPVPSIDYNSTRFTFLKLPEGASKWMYKVGDSTFGLVETGVEVKDSKALNPTDMDIKPVYSNDYLLLLATDNDSKVLAYTEIRLNDSDVKGGVAEEILESNYKVEKGNSPKTTRIVKFDTLGLKDPGSTRWKVKWVENEPTEDKDKPYVGSVIDGIAGYYREGTDIPVKETSEGKYGYILLLATDSMGRTKAYRYIPLDSTHVKEHAPIIERAKLVKGDSIDSVKVEGLEAGKIYKYILDTKAFVTPSLGDYLPINPKDYSIGGDIKVKFNEHLTIFELDSEGKIARYAAFVIDPLAGIVNQGTGTFSLIDLINNDNPNILLEGEINNGGKKLKISLVGANWVGDLAKNQDLRTKLYRGLVANNQIGEWNKAVTALLNGGYGNIQVSGKDLTISLINSPSYDIYEEQEITMEIHPDLIEGAINPVYALGKIVIKPTIKASISGDVTSDIVRAKDIKTGGKTIVITLIDGNWEINLDKNTLREGFTSNGGNWEKIAGNLKDGDIIRASNKEIKITLPPMDVGNWGTKTETVSLRIDKKLLIDAVDDVVATPSFILYPDVLQVKGEAMVNGEPTNEVLMKAPDGKQVHEKYNKWQITVVEGNLKDDLSIKDLTISGLPKGLVATAIKGENNVIEITLSGTSSTSISNLDIYTIINGTAVVEPNSVGSEAIKLELKMAEGMAFEGVNYKIDGGFIRFSGITNDMEYSTNSPDGIKGDWKVGTNAEVQLSLEPMVVYVREKAQPLVFKKFVFENGDAPKDISISSYVYREDGNVDIMLMGIDKDIMEYSVNGGAKYDEFTGDVITLTQDGDFRVRYRAIEGERDVGKLPSKGTPKLNGVYLGDVILSAGDGKILGTNGNMEYSLGSTNGTDGIWVPTKSNEISIIFSLGNNVWIREKSSTVNYRYLGTIKQADKPSLNNVHYNVALGKIANQSSQDLEYRIAGGPWNTIWKSTDVFGVDFKPGILEFRIKAVGDVLASLPVVKDTIPTEKSAPVIVIDDVKNHVFSINELDRDKNWNEFEYRVNPNSATPWTSGENLVDEDLSGDKSVEIRLKATKYTLPSKVGIVKFTKNLDLKLVTLSEYANPPILNGTTNVMEYKIETVNSTTSWAKASNGDTVLPNWFKEYWDNKLLVSLVVRDGRIGQQENTRDIVQDFPDYKTNNDTKFENISYKFENKKIIFSGISNLMEYSTDGENWIIGNGKDVSFPDEPLILRIRLVDVPSVFKDYEINRPDAPTGVTIKSYVYSDDGSQLTVELEGLVNGMEYSIDGGENWIEYNGISVLYNLDKEYNLRVRYKFKTGDKENGALSSNPTAKLNPIYLGNVGININPSGTFLINTDVNMEYRIDPYEGNIGQWKSASYPNTMVDLKLKDTLWIRENGKDIHVWEIGVVGQESIPNLANVHYNIALNKIANQSSQDLEYRVNGGRWVVINSGEDDLNVDFKAGPLEFRKQAKGSNLPSLPVTKEVIKAPGSMPVVDYDDVKNVIVFIDRLTDWKDYEYMILSGSSLDKWTSAVELRNKNFPGDIKVEIRKVATKEDLPSQIRQISFTTNLELKHVRLSTNVKPFELNGTTTQMQYNIYLKDGRNTDWINCVTDEKGNTKLPEWLTDIGIVTKIEVRDKNQVQNKVEIKLQ